MSYDVECREGDETKEPAMSRVARIAALLPLLFAGCVISKSSGTAPGEIAPKLALSTYYEEGTQIAIVVGVRPALFRKDRQYVPLEIAVVNKGLPGVTVSRESFVLVDPEGDSYPAVSSQELLKANVSRDLDTRLGEIESVVARRYGQLGRGTYQRVRSNLTPGFDDAIARDPVPLGRFNYLVDMIYFPNPGLSKKVGPFDVLVRVPELPNPLVVRFNFGS
jgi:hypothetical protein